VSPYFWSRGTRRLHGVAISHPHSDHVGMRSIIANFRPQELWYRLESPTPEFVELAATARNFGVAFRPRVAGEAFDFGGVQVSVPNPRVGESAANPAQDDESMLLRFEFRESSALLVGDAHKRTGSLLEGENPRADLQNRAPRQRDIQFTRLPAGGCVAVRGGISWVLQHVPPPAALYHEALR